MPQPELFYGTVTIANGTTVSPAIDLKNFSLVGIVTPAALTGANFSFQGAPGVSDGNGNYTAGAYSPIYSGTTALSYAVGTNRHVIIPDFIPARFLKIVSDASEGADRILLLILKPI